MRPSSPRLARAFALAATLLPAAAWACPACASREDTTGQVGWAVAGMLLSPLAVGAVIATVARKLEQKG